MSEYEEMVNRMTLTPEQKAEREALAQAYLAKIQPVFDRLRSGEITRDEALDLLTEIKGGGSLAKESANRLLSRTRLGERFE